MKNTEKKTLKEMKVTESFLVKGKKLFPAKCSCGYEGKSQSPKYYRCGFCYYKTRAESRKKLAAKLRARAIKLDGEAREYLRQARDFQKRHPEAGKS